MFRTVDFILRPYISPRFYVPVFLGLLDSELTSTNRAYSMCCTVEESTMPTYPKRPPLAVLPLCPMFLVSIILCYDVISGKTIEKYRCHKYLTFSRQSLPVNYGNHTRPLLTVEGRTEKICCCWRGYLG